MEGRWQDARESSDRGLTLGPNDMLALGWRVKLEYSAGEFDDGERYLKRLIEARQVNESYPALCFLATAIPLAARLSGRIQYFDIAEDAAQKVLSSGSACPFYVDVARRGLALMAIVKGDASAAADQYDNLRSARGLWYSLAAPHLLGLLACTIGRPDEAADHFEDAVKAYSEGGIRPDLAWCSYDYAEMLLQRAADDDNEKATALLGEALAISRELGMRPLIERAVSLSEEFAAQPSRGPTYLNGLTHREVEVLRLVAAGKSNQEIAETLVVSIRTVTTHITNIFSKTGATNRAEAVIYATRHRLAD